MNNSHDYHGITLRNDGAGWTIQLKLLSKYRQLRTYASNAEEAARRHDAALCKLEGFADANAQPNFPDEFNDLKIDQSAFSEKDGGLAFFKDLSELFSTLAHEAQAVGLDPMEMATHVRELARVKKETVALKREMARTKFNHQLSKLLFTVPLLGLPADKTTQVKLMLEQTKRIFELAIKP